MTVTRVNADALGVARRKTRRNGGRHLDDAALAALPELAREAVAEAIGGRTNVSPYLIVDEQPRVIEVVIRNRT